MWDFFYRKPCKYLSAYWNSECTFLSITSVRKSYKNKFVCGISDPCSWMIYCDVNNICSYCVTAFPTEMLKSESENEGKVLFPQITWAHQDEVAVMNFPLLKWKYLAKSYLKRMALCRPLYFQSKMISSLPYPPTHKRDHFSAIFKNEALNVLFYFVSIILPHLYI